MESTNDWSQPEQQFDPIVGIGDTDFNNLVDLDFNTFDFLDFNQQNNGDNPAKLPSSVDLNLLSDAAAQHHALQQAQQQLTSGTANAKAHMQRSMMFNVNVSPHAHAHAHQIVYNGQHHQAYALQQEAMAMQQQQQQQQHNFMLPPTPNSADMHGDASHHLQQMDAQSRAMLEQHYQQQRNREANFIAISTPAVTPHDAQFTVVPEYTVPGAYFSPLTSPALEGQHQNKQQRSSSSTSTASPADIDVDMLADPALPKVSSRKTRRPTKAPRSGATGRKVAQSPIQKPVQRRKSALLTVIPPKEVSELLEAHSKSGHSPTSPTIIRHRYVSSSAESISPEPIPEALMGPPPIPSSAKPSPAIQAIRSPNFRPSDARTSPATPASLMRISSREPQDGVSVTSPVQDGETGALPPLFDLALPEAATKDQGSPRLAQMGASAADGNATPRVSPRKTAKLGPRLTPFGSAKTTPLASAVTSPIMSSASPIASRRPELKSRGGKKRGTNPGNVLVSPALRPRISPNIKPLLPESSRLADDHHAVFLASRSNYQNLIEGTSLPGVTYPDDLPTQLTSKRTSHKVAEQGRRQRINVAISELQTLLPKSSPDAAVKNGSSGNEDDEDDDGKRTGGKGGGNSKAATVEAGIAYIRILQKESERVKKEKDSEMEALKKRLAEMEKKLAESRSGEMQAEN